MATQSTVTPNALVAANPSLNDAMNYMAKKINLELNCHHVGTIKTFNPLNQTATVGINYVKTFVKQNDIGNPTTFTKEYPVILDVPVVFLGGGLACLTFPVNTGDECIVLFNDRDFDNWFTGSSNSAPNTGRLHSYSDAMAIVGIRSLANVISSFDTNAAALRYGNNSFKIGANSATLDLGPAMSAAFNSDGTFSVTNPTDELLNSIYNLLVDIQNATTMTMLGPQPLVMPTFATDLLKFETFIS